MPDWLPVIPGLLAGAAVVLLAGAGSGAGGASAPARRPWRSVLDREAGLAAAAGLRPGLLLTLEAAPALAAGLLAGLLSGLPVLALAAGVAAAASARLVLRVRVQAGARRRQDAVLDALRMLRGVLESGGSGVQEALAALARKGPVPLRGEFAAIVAASRTGGQGQAWAQARARVGDPLFDLLSAAILVQRPSGGSIVPLLSDLEESVAAIHEVTREAEALQVQARSAAALITLLPIAFLLVLAAFRSPYLDAYRNPTGAAFLAAMLCVIGLAHAWILRWLRLPSEPRLAVS